MPDASKANSLITALLCLLLPAGCTKPVSYSKS
jgi:hypothetical protein